MIKIIKIERYITNTKIEEKNNKETRIFICMNIKTSMRLFHG